MKAQKMNVKVIHSESKPAWNIVNTILGGKYKLVNVPYVRTDDIANSEEARKLANYLANCINRIGRDRANEPLVVGTLDPDTASKIDKMFSDIASSQDPIPDPKPMKPDPIPRNPPKPPKCVNCGLYQGFVGMHTRTCQCPDYLININKTIKMEKPDGLYRKYKIERTDGTLINPENEYFILKVKGIGDQKHIDACRKAVITYAEEMRRELPELANDLFIRYGEATDPKSHIGIMPEHLWKEERFRELKEVIRHYLEADFPLPKDWVTWVAEYNELLDQIRNRYDKR